MHVPAVEGIATIRRIAQEFTDSISWYGRRKEVPWPYPHRSLRRASACSQAHQHGLSRDRAGEPPRHIDKDLSSLSSYPVLK
jgi:hypothetical protein